MPNTNTKASYFNFVTMMLLLHLTKRPTLTQRPLSLASMLMKIFRVEDSMLFVAKKIERGIMRLSHEK